MPPTGDNSAINTIKLSEYTREQIGLHKYIKDKLDSVNDDSFSLTPEEIAEIFENRWMDNDLVPTKENRRATGNYFFNDMTQRMEDEYVTFPTIQSTENISKSGAAKFTGNTYPLAFVDEKPTNSNMVGSLGESSLFIPYIKQRIAHKNGESSYVLYKLGGQVTEMKTGRIFPVYVAVDKKGSKESGLSIIEHGLSEQSIVKSNILPQKITVEDILSIKNKMGFGQLPANLREIAELRLEYPDATLKELGGLIEPAVGKSGVNHRLRKLSELAESLKQ